MSVKKNPRIPNRSSKQKHNSTSQGSRELLKPLTSLELEFIKNYLRSGNAVESVRLIPEYANKSYSTCSQLGNNILKRPRVQSEMRRIMEEARREAVATAEEVMSYFTAVMRGEVKDQFGLDAPLAERTRAAQEIARRTVDIENRQKGLADQTVEITLDWSRK